MNHDSMAGGFQAGLGTPVWSPNLTPMSEPAYIGALIGLFLLSIGFRALMAAQGYLEAYLHLHYYPRPTSSSSSSSHSRQPRQAQQQQQEQLLPPPTMAQNGSAAVSEDSTELDEKNEEIVLQAHPTTTPSGTTPSSSPLGLRARLGNKPPIYHHSRPSPSTLAPPSLCPPTTEPSFLYPLPTVQPFVWQAEIARAVLTTAVVGIGYMLMLVVMTYHSAYFAVILVGIFVGEVYFGRWGRVRPIFPPAAPPASSCSSRSQQQPVMRIPNNNNNTSHLAQYSQHPASASRTSMASRASSHGYSAMIHHSGAADGAC